jgi:hypothetical protein
LEIPAVFRTFLRINCNIGSFPVELFRKMYTNLGVSSFVMGKANGVVRKTLEI